ncbi:hypothetical protein BLNAU_8561 [Blattamonas nauphoetae]|uniref:Uncharacterized protein n=1 Tax=Blattamonas nauphoetae TaxID=2049346 RepID=A0ABQ9XYE8_9EUKA|nr:hypothetical protein BLNAU_8561 [Blattamonas nauphoetae]
MLESPHKFIQITQRSLPRNNDVVGDIGDWREGSLPVFHVIVHQNLVEGVDVSCRLADYRQKKKTSRHSEIADSPRQRPIPNSATSDGCTVGRPRLILSATPQRAPTQASSHLPQTHIRADSATRVALASEQPSLLPVPPFDPVYDQKSSSDMFRRLVTCHNNSNSRHTPSRHSEIADSPRHRPIPDSATSDGCTVGRTRPILSRNSPTCSNASIISSPPNTHPSQAATARVRSSNSRAVQREWFSLLSNHPLCPFRLLTHFPHPPLSLRTQICCWPAHFTLSKVCYQWNVSTMTWRAEWRAEGSAIQLTRVMNPLLVGDGDRRRVPPLSLHPPQPISHNSFPKSRLLPSLHARAVSNESRLYHRHVQHDQRRVAVRHFHVWHCIRQRRELNTKSNQLCVSFWLISFVLSFGERLQSAQEWWRGVCTSVHQSEFHSALSESGTNRFITSSMRGISTVGELEEHAMPIVLQRGQHELNEVSSARLSRPSADQASV